MVFPGELQSLAGYREGCGGPRSAGALLQSPSEKKKTRAGRREGELPADISPEHSGKKSEAGHDEAGKLKRPRGRPHYSETVIREMRSPCSILSTTSWPETTWPKTV